MKNMETRTIEIDGQPEQYYIEIARTDHNRRWSITVHYKGRQKYVSQNLLVDDAGSLDAMKALADKAVSEIHRELSQRRD